MKTTLIPIHPVELNGHEIDLCLAIEDEAVEGIIFPIEQLNHVLLASGNATPQVLDAVRRYVRLEVRTLETVAGTVEVMNAEEAAPLFSRLFALGLLTDKQLILLHRAINAASASAFESPWGITLAGLLGANHGAA